MDGDGDAAASEAAIAAAEIPAASAAPAAQSCPDQATLFLRFRRDASVACPPGIQWQPANMRPAGAAEIASETGWTWVVVCGW